MENRGSRINGQPDQVSCIRQEERREKHKGGKGAQLERIEEK
jgi:hypothetical protein